mgnify:CR=1 FL=1
MAPDPETVVNIVRLSRSSRAQEEPEKYEVPAFHPKWRDCELSLTFEGWKVLSGRAESDRCKPLGSEEMVLFALHADTERAAGRRRVRHH